ncbi:MAG: adenosylcobinamide-GDP ribazoletransferase [Candidatus Promineifilaceae bacterium]
MKTRIQREFQLFFIAISFLTTLPVPSTPFIEGGLGKSGRWFTVIGVMIGGLVFALNRLLITHVDSWVVAILVVVVWICLTGGLHLDGFADCCDGLIASVPAEKRLSIMKDPTVGTFAALGLILLITLKIALVHALLPAEPSSSLPIMTAVIVSRWLILPVALQPSAREGGMGAAFAETVTTDVLLVALILPVVLLILGGTATVIAMLVAHFLTVWLVSVVHKRIGGVTGDVFGLVVEVAEVVILLTFVLTGSYGIV